MRVDNAKPMQRIIQKSAWLLALLLLASAVPGCAPSLSVDDGQHPRPGALFRHRWWNYYLRGLERADRQQFAAAREDLVHAIGLRDGDRRMARTYGMRFMDYFAHRELGIVHWHTRELDSARAELERSIRQTPSAKAHYYLDRVRQALIRRDGADPAPPRVELDLPEGVFWTREDPVTLSGRIQDPNFVARVSIGNEVLFMPGSQTDVAFSHPLDLPQGRHVVALQTENLAEGTSRRQVEIAVDRQGPWIIVETAARVGGQLVFEGEIFDDAGAAALVINGRSIAIEPGSRTRFRFALEAAAAMVHLTARDRLGNRTHARLPKSYWQALRPNRPLTAAGRDDALLAGLLGGRDNEAPVIRLEQWGPSQTVYLDRVVLAGTVRDRGGVKRLTVNGTPVLPQAGPMIIFSHFVSLKPGDNTIAIEATDAAGNRSHHTVAIERKVPKALLLDHRLRLSVFPFELKGEVTSAGLAFQDDFIDRLIQRRRFQVVERQRLDLILEEQKLSRTQLLDRSTALELGRLAAAHVIAAGRMVQTRTGIEIVGRVIDCETAEILDTVDAYSEETDLKGFRAMAEALALKIHRDFPLVDGIVVEKNGGIIFTDLGTQKIRAQRRMLVYDERPVRHPSSGAPLGVDHRILARARVVQCDEALSKAELQAGFDPAVGPRHKVITQ
jgi:TolB-like protein